MAGFMDNQKVRTAITDNTKLDMSHTNVTTSDFMQWNIATIMELVPGTKLDFDMEAFCRLNPLPVPTFGRANLKFWYHWVPFRTLMGGSSWNDFITDSVHVASDGYSAGYTGTLLQNVPTVTMGALQGAFLNWVAQSSTDGSGFIYQVAPNQSNSNWDLFNTVNGVTTYYCYTVKGRRALALLEALGYKIDWSGSKSEVFSALPLLSACRIFVDWFYPQQYSNRVEFDLIMALLNMDVRAGVQSLTDAQVNSVLSLITYVCYPSDLLTMAWDNPSGPNAGNYSDNFKLVNIDTVSSYYTNSLVNYSETGYVTNNNGAATSSDRLGGAQAPFITPYMSASNSAGYAATPISENLLHMLHSLSDYLKRHQLAGSGAFSALNRYLARFGKSLPTEALNHSTYLGGYAQGVQIGDVMSQSDTTGASLGAFAGRGLSFGSGHAEFSATEYGYFIVSYSVIPATGYFQGIDPITQRVTKLDFYTPEFEGGPAVEAISAANVYIPQVPSEMTTGDPFSQVFGFTPKYASYKAPTFMDRVGGNFRIPSINGGNFVNGSSSWHLFRTFDGVEDFNRDYANVVHSPNFVYGGADPVEFKRIFYNNDADSPDNFTLIMNFECAEYFPGKGLFENYEFEDAGKEITLQTNGTRLK